MELKLESVDAIKDTDGNYVAALQLGEPIKQVIGSLHNMPANGYKSLIATNVTEVLVPESLLSIVEYDEENQIIRTDLLLDVSRTGNVWLTDRLFFDS